MNLDKYLPVKIWIGDNLKLSKQVQKQLFKLGYHWRTDTQQLFLDYNITSLFIDENKTLAFSNTYTYEEFKNHDRPYKESKRYTEILVSQLLIPYHKIIKRIINEKL